MKSTKYVVEIPNDFIIPDRMNNLTTQEAKFMIETTSNILESIDSLMYSEVKCNVDSDNNLTEIYNNIINKLEDFKKDIRDDINTSIMNNFNMLREYISKEKDNTLWLDNMNNYMNDKFKELNSLAEENIEKIEKLYNVGKSDMELLKSSIEQNNVDIKLFNEKSIEITNKFKELNDNLMDNLSNRDIDKNIIDNINEIKSLVDKNLLHSDSTILSLKEEVVNIVNQDNKEYQSLLISMQDKICQQIALLSSNNSKNHSNVENLNELYDEAICSSIKKNISNQIVEINNNISISNENIKLLSIINTNIVDKINNLSSSSQIENHIVNLSNRIQKIDDTLQPIFKLNSKQYTEKGKAAEEYILQYLQDTYKDSTAQNVSESKEKIGDIAFIKQHMTCMIEIKNKEKLTREDIENFNKGVHNHINSSTLFMHKDKTKFNCGIFISLLSNNFPGIGKCSFIRSKDFGSGIPVVYIYTNGISNIEVIDTAISILYNVVEFNIEKNISNENKNEEELKCLIDDFNTSSSIIKETIIKLKKNVNDINKTIKKLEEVSQRLDDHENGKLNSLLHKNNLDGSEEEQESSLIKKNSSKVPSLLLEEKNDSTELDLNNKLDNSCLKIVEVLKDITAKNDLKKMIISLRNTEITYDYNRDNVYCKILGTLISHLYKCMSADTVAYSSDGELPAIIDIIHKFDPRITDDLFTDVKELISYYITINNVSVVTGGRGTKGYESLFIISKFILEKYIGNIKNTTPIGFVDNRHILSIKNGVDPNICGTTGKGGFVSKFRKFYSSRDKNNKLVADSLDNFASKLVKYIIIYIYINRDVNYRGRTLLEELNLDHSNVNLGFLLEVYINMLLKNSKHNQFIVHLAPGIESFNKYIYPEINIVLESNTSAYTSNIALSIEEKVNTERVKPNNNSNSTTTTKRLNNLHSLEEDDSDE